MHEAASSHSANMSAFAACLTPDLAATQETGPEIAAADMARSAARAGPASTSVIEPA